MGGKLTNISFENASNDREHNIFTPEYFGGADVRIFIDGKEYKNISSIEVSIREQQKPIYGYASRVYDDIAHGNRIVQGAIRVPIKNIALPIKKDTNKQIREIEYDDIEIPEWVLNQEKKYENEIIENKNIDINNNRIKITNQNLHIAPNKNSKIIRNIQNAIGNIISEINGYYYINIANEKGFICKI